MCYATHFVSSIPLLSITNRLPEALYIKKKKLTLNPSSLSNFLCWSYHIGTNNKCTICSRDENNSYYKVYIIIESGKVGVIYIYTYLSYL